MASTFTYVTYIATTPEKLWEAITNPDLTQQYWGCRNVSDWNVGSQWEHQRPDESRIVDVVGTIVESEPGKRLVFTWAAPGDEGNYSTVTFDFEKREGETVAVTLTNDDIKDEAELKETAIGWAQVLSNLKTFLETGRTLSGLW